MGMGRLSRMKKTWLELMDHCRNNSDKIYVRYQLNGIWGNYSLSEIPSDDAIGFIDKWFTESWEF